MILITLRWGWGGRGGGVDALTRKRQGIPAAALTRQRPAKQNLFSSKIYFQCLRHHMLCRRYGGLAQPFLILILEGAPLLSRLLRQGGDFDLRELRMPSQVPRPVPAKNAGTRTGQPLDLRFYSERIGPAPGGRLGHPPFIPSGVQQLILTPSQALSPLRDRPAA